MLIRKQKRLRGELMIPGDKSISHRAVMFGSLAEGTTVIRNFLEGEDCLSTISCFRSMGIDIEKKEGEILVRGNGLHGLRAPEKLLYTGNSGTTTRLISGILAGQSFSSTLDGDASLRTRPMKRIIDPLSQMGARIATKEKSGCLPLTICGGNLHGIEYRSPVASAQVKSCILLAGLYANGSTSVTEPVLSRDHTERMLRSFGADITTVEAFGPDSSTGSQSDLLSRENHRSEQSEPPVSEPRITIQPEPTLTCQQITVPGDISTAAYYIAAGLITPNSEILLRNVGINPTRDGMLRVLKQMGADISLLNENLQGEPSADLLVRTSTLHPVTIEGSLIPTLIDELPILAVLAAFADGTTVIRDAAELRVKESDRIASVTAGLSAMGCDVEPMPDGMIIHGGKPLHGGRVDSCRDHRIAMSFAVAGTVCDGDLEIQDAECVNISCPDFYHNLYMAAF